MFHRGGGSGRGEWVLKPRVPTHILSIIILLPLLTRLLRQVGVEHLLRDINDPSTSSLALEIKQKVNGLGGLLGRLSEMKIYLEKVVSGRLPVNNQIAYNLQNILNLLPNLNVDELVRALLVKTNDLHLVLYLSSLIRSVLALHGLLANKIKYRDMDEVLDREAGIDSSDKDKDKDEAREKDSQSPGKDKDKEKEKGREGADADVDAGSTEEKS